MNSARTASRDSLARRAFLAGVGAARQLWELARPCRLWVLLVPMVVGGLVFLLMHTTYHSLAGKEFQEVISPAILLAATVAGGALYARYRHLYLRWQSFLAGALFLRELHFVGTNNGIYVALVVLLWYAARNRQRLGPFVEDRRLMTLLCGALWTYAIAMAFDRGYWRPFLPGLGTLRDPLEETLECAGHLLILGTVLSSWRLAAGWGDSPRVWRDGRMLGWTSLIIALPTVALLAVVQIRSHDDDPAIKAARGEFPYELSSVCPVNSALGERLFLAAADDSRDLCLWTLDPAGRAALVTTLELTVPNDGNDGAGFQLDDLEGLAWDGDQTYYAVTSHRRLLPEEDAAHPSAKRATECALVRFELSRTTGGVEATNARLVCRDLLGRVRQLGVFETVNWRHSKTFCWQELKKSWQIDLEGLAVVDGAILLAFKNPVEEGRATILSYDPQADHLAVCARPKLNGQGILSLDYDRKRDRLLVLTNERLKGTVGDSCLWIATREKPSGEKWRFADAPFSILERASEGRRRKASGLAVWKDRLLVSFDDAHEAVIREFPLVHGVSMAEGTDLLRR